MCGVNESYDIGVASETAYAANSQADVAVDEAACQTWLANRSHIPKMPVTCVDWCDAYAYCAWAGKKLCGSFDEDDPYVVISNEPEEAAARYKDASVSRWSAACSGALGRAFPYGDTFDPAPCNDQNMGAVEAAHDTCVGGYPDLYDLSGNAGEWEAACTRYGNPDPWNQNCLIRGGAFYEGLDGVSCGALRDNYMHLISDGVGFRCCQDKPE